MKKLILSGTILLGAVIGSQAGVHFSVGIGLPMPGVVISQPAPVVYQAPPVVYQASPPLVYQAPARVVYSTPPAMVYAPAPVVVCPPPPVSTVVVATPGIYLSFGRSWHGHYWGPGYAHGWHRR